MIDPRIAKLILEEHKYKPISGDVLTVGKQTLTLKRENFPELEPLFNADALDVSDYEGAKYIADLNDPVKDLFGIADFIFNGSCMDNLFNPAEATKNMSRLLRSGGRIVHIEMGCPKQTAYLMYSPAWFFDFYAINNYTDCKLYTCHFKENYLDEWEIKNWQPFNEGKLVPYPEGNFVNFVIAEKADNSTDDKMPIQGHYRVAHNNNDDLYFKAYERFNSSIRPILKIEKI